MPWVNKKQHPRGCKMPGFLARVVAADGSVWECPRCGKQWILTTEAFTGDTMFLDVDPEVEECQ